MRRVALLVALFLAPALHAQDSSAYYRTSSLTQKDGTVAFALSFVLPGLGQVYAGEPAFGAVFFTAAAGGTALAIYNAQYVDRCVNTSPFSGSCSLERRNSGMVTAGLFIAAATWFASMAEAPVAAQRFNQTHRVAFRIEPGAVGTVRVGVALQR